MDKSEIIRNLVSKPAVFKLIIVLVLFVENILFGISAFAESSIDMEQEENGKVPGVIRGLLDLSDRIEVESGMEEAKKILTNQLGLERINEDRKKNGLPELLINDVCEFGDEIVKEDTSDLPPRKSVAAGKTSITGVAVMSAISSLPQYDEIVTDTLPASIDNSQLPSFPPIGDQGQLNSCVSYSTTYYQMTHMFGMSLGWDVKNDTENLRKFSPKWTFNLTNAGENGVFGMNSTFLLFLKCGAALWNEFPYNPDDRSLKNYTNWPTDASVWRNALNYRIDDYGYVKIWDGSQTPVEGPDDPDLKKVKQLLNNGYVLTFETNVSRWRFSKIDDDTSTNEDDAFKGQHIAHMTDKAELKIDGHVMTLVGYNDNIWVDINKNGIVEKGEKGAFKIANSWGTSEELISSDGNFSWYSNDGFVWLSYDALNKASAVPDCPASERRNVINGENKVYWISPGKNTTPKLLVEYTLSHSNKYEIETLFGYSNYDKQSPVSYFDPYNINLLTSNQNIRSSFDGTNNVCDATLVFDISELYDKYDSIKGNLYISLLDKEKGNPCTLKDVKIIDNVSGQTYYYDGGLPKSFDGELFTVGPIGFTKDISSLKGLKLSSSSIPTKRNYPAVATYDNLVYVIGGISDNGNYLNTVEVYDPETDTWETKRDMFCNQSGIPYAVTADDRMFVIEKLASGEAIIEEYSSNSDKWIFKRQVNYWEDMDVVETNGKIYIVGADDADYNEDVVFRIEEYDTVTNEISEGTYLEKGWVPVSTGAYNGKIYIFGMRRYNPDANIAAMDSIYEYDMRLRVYDPVNNTWEIGEEVSFNASRGTTMLNGKFYGFYSDMGEGAIKICEYDPQTNNSEIFSGNCMNRTGFGIFTYKDSIIIIGGRTNTSATEIDSVTDALEIVTIEQEKIPPVLEPPKDLIIEAKGQSTVVDIGDADSFGNSDVIVTNNAPDTFPIGTTYVLWTAEDLGGNITKAIQEVTLVIGKTAPDLIIPSDIVAGTNGSERYIDIGKAFVRNDVGVTITNDAPLMFPLGKTIVNWTAVDSFLNITCDTQMLYVYKYGDIDGNGKVNAIDFAYLKLFMLGVIQELPGELGKYAADVNGDYSISSLDLALIKQYLLGYINDFPAKS